MMQFDAWGEPVRPHDSRSFPSLTSDRSIGAAGSESAGNASFNLLRTLGILWLDDAGNDVGKRRWTRRRCAANNARDGGPCREQRHLQFTAGRNRYFESALRHLPWTGMR